MAEKNLKRPGQLKAYLALTWYSFRAQTRNPATFFFGFVFPIVFISIFGLISNSPPKTVIGIPNDQVTKQLQATNTEFASTLTQQGPLEIKRGTTQELEQQLKQGKLVGIVQQVENPVANPSLEIHLTTSSANPQQAAIVKLLLTNTVAGSALEQVRKQDPSLVIPQRLVEKEISGRESRYIDFALPGQIGFSLLSTAIFGTVFGLIYLKKALILKRMFATPTKALTILLAQGTSRLIVALAQTILILLIGVFIFKFFLPHGIWTFFQLVILSAFGLIAFLGFGYLIAGLSNDENAASPLTNLVTLPQFLLGGTFFPTESLPGWIQPIANNLPLSYFNIAVRKITTEGGNFSDTYPYLLGLLIWGAIMYILAARTFKWQ